MPGNPFPSLIDLAALGARGFKLQGEVGLDYAGYSVSFAGDVNDDGITDLIVGAYRNDSGGTNAGAAYVVHGGQDLSGTVSLSAVGATVDGFKLQGEAAEDWAGVSVASVGDVNDDGITDLIVGAYLNDSGGTNAGAAYVVHGGQDLSGTVSLSTVGITVDGFKLEGEAAGDSAGWPASSAGDVDGDGIDDIIIGAYLNDSGGADAGAAYVVYGGQVFASQLDLGDVGGAVDGFRLVGEAASDRAGISVASAGDVNNDGFDDIIVGARGNDGGGFNTGAAYVVYGKASGLSGTFDLGAVGDTLAGFVGREERPSG